jgi:hypothetical protein
MEFEIDIEKLKQGGLFIGMPCYGGVMYGSTARSLMDLTSICTRYGIEMKIFFLFNESLIQRARNYVADEFLRSGCETMLFIDSDITFSAKDVLAMMHMSVTEEKYNIICGPYPKKVISWEKIVKAVDKGFAENNPNDLENFVGDYAFSVLESGKISLSEPVEVLESGTGFMMIQKSALEKFRDAYPQYQYSPDHVRTANFDGSRKIHAFFHCEIDPETGRYLSEDYWFCQMARKAGLKVWLCPWIQLEHTGTYTFKGSLPHIAAAGASINI